MKPNGIGSVTTMFEARDGPPLATVTLHAIVCGVGGLPGKRKWLPYVRVEGVVGLRRLHVDAALHGGRRHCSGCCW